MPKGVTLRKGNFFFIDGGQYGDSRRMKRSDFEKIENGSSLKTFANGRLNKSVVFDKTPDAAGLNTSLPDLNVSTELKNTTEITLSKAFDIEEP